MAVGIDEDARVSAPERLSRLATDRSAPPPRPLDHRVDLLRRAHVVSERHAAPTAAVGHGAVLREQRAVPQGDHQPPGREEPDAPPRRTTGLPAERLVEGPRIRQVAHAEGYQADPLLHGP